MDNDPGSPSGPPPPSFNPIASPGLRPTGIYPLDLNKILEMTFSIVRFRWRVMLPVSFAIMLPVAALSGATAAVTAEENTAWFELVLQLWRGRPVDVAANFPWAVILLGLVVGAIVAVANWLASAAVTHIAAETYQGRAVETRQALRKGFSRLPSLAGIYLLTFLALAGILFVGAFAGSLLFAMGNVDGRLTPGPAVFIGILVFVAAFAALVFVNVRWSLAVPVTVMESTGVLATLRISWRLVAGSTWRVIGFLIVLGLMVGTVAFMLTLVITIAVGAASMSATQVQQVDPVRLGIASFLSLLIGTALMPFTAVATLLLYFDLKWRAGGAVPTPGVPVPSVPEQQP